MKKLVIKIQKEKKREKKQKRTKTNKNQKQNKQKKGQCASFWYIVYYKYILPHETILILWLLYLYKSYDTFYK